jgi:di- and tripeptidase
MSCHKSLEEDPLQPRQLPLRTRLPSQKLEESYDATPSPAIRTPEELLVHRWHHEHSILSTAAFPSLGFLFCGTYDHQILVLDIETFEKKYILRGHTGSVLCLTKSNDEKYLFSGGSDSLVKVWDIREMKETHTIYSLVDIGDIFSLCWCNENSTIYFGCQNASILFVEFNSMMHTGDPNSLPSNRFDKFFDSKGPTGVISSSKKAIEPESARLIEVPSSSIITYAHNGFIYDMKLYDQNKLISGGGDGIVNIWDLSGDRPSVIETLDNDESVLSLALHENFLYCGLTNGQLKLWDLQTSQQMMTLQSEDDEKDEDDTLSIAATNYCIFKASKDGVSKWKFGGTNSKHFWAAHQGLVLTSEIFTRDGKIYLVTGGNDASVALWNITNDNQPVNLHRKSIIDIDNESLLQHLSEFVSFKTVSKKPELFIDDSRRCAHYLTNLFTRFGAESELIPVENGNPVVYACFKGRASMDASSPRILWYGHYDVIEAEDGVNWDSDPFKVVASDGYLHGRGVSDNKGPILAAIYAVADILQTGQLTSDIVFLIEGEEECGSFGFQDTIKKNINLIGDIDWIMLSNSYWLDEATPCLNYGLRGVLSVTVEISSDSPDRHSGVEGGVSREPTMDLIKLLSKLTDDDGTVLIPQFYDTIKALTPEEEKLYDDICSKTTIPTSKETLLAKWKFPSLTVHKIDVSGPGNSTVIPKSSTGFLSIRMVPEQNSDHIKQSLLEFLNLSFAKMKSDNHLEVRVIHEAEPWLGERGNAAYKILEHEIIKEWGKEPFYVREGGSIPSVRFLEKIFGAPAAQIPCGQSTDNAHLDNERLRVANLYALRRILKGSFKQLPKQPSK